MQCARIDVLFSQHLANCIMDISTAMFGGTNSMPRKAEQVLKDQDDKLAKKAERVASCAARLKQLEAQLEAQRAKELEALRVKEAEELEALRTAAEHEQRVTAFKEAQRVLHKAEREQRGLDTQIAPVKEEIKAIETHTIVCTSGPSGTRCWYIQPATCRSTGPVC